MLLYSLVRQVVKEVCNDYGSPDISESGMYDPENRCGKERSYLLDYALNTLNERFSGDDHECDNQEEELKSLGFAIELKEKLLEYRKKEDNA